MQLDLRLLIDKSIVAIEKRDYTWSFCFSGGDSLGTEQSWRFVSDGLWVTSEDHDQKYGMPKPADAGELLKSELGASPIVNARHDRRTGDLFLDFQGGKYLQFLQMSSGYESWRLRMGKREFICLGRGEYASFESV